jgi:hypothetical protein
LDVVSEQAKAKRKEYAVMVCAETEDIGIDSLEADAEKGMPRLNITLLASYTYLSII